MSRSVLAGSVTKVIVDPQEIKRRMGAWPKGKLIEIENAQHEVLMETPDIRRRAMSEIAAFVERTKENVDA